MREVKIRAWDKKEKQMIIPQFITNNKTKEDDYIYLQYTGLNDENGTEIYEGDIVEINKHKYSITFEIGSFMLVRCSDETDMYEQFENCWCDDVYPLSQYYWDSNGEEDHLGNCEVIGNIYQEK